MKYIISEYIFQLPIFLLVFLGLKKKKKELEVALKI